METVITQEKYEKLAEKLKDALFKQAKYCQLKTELEKTWYREATAEVELLKKVFKIVYDDEADSIIQKIYVEGEKEFHEKYPTKV